MMLKNKLSDKTVLHKIIMIYDILRTNLASNKITITPIEGKCLVFGSAPNPIIPSDFDKTWTLITVNASQTSVNLKPNYTVIIGQFFSNSPANIEGKAAITNKKDRQTDFN